MTGKADELELVGVQLLGPVGPVRVRRGGAEDEGGSCEQRGPAECGCGSHAATVGPTSNRPVMAL